MGEKKNESLHIPMAKYIFTEPNIFYEKIKENLINSKFKMLFS